MADILIRPAVEADLAAINDIYNYYVTRSTCTYQEEPETMVGRAAWFRRHGADHPIIVATRDGNLLGWGSLSPFHARSAYRRTVENSVYVSYEHQRGGIGRSLLLDLVSRARGMGHHTIVALIDGEQAASIALHEACGFTRAGILEEVGFKFGRWLGVVYMQRVLTDVDKVLVYALRRRGSRNEVLVHEHRDAPGAGVQVPAGTVEAGETASNAAARELFEETGLGATSRPALIRVYRWFNDDTRGWNLRHVYTVDVQQGGPDAWAHTISGNGQDRRMVFHCRWLPLDEATHALVGDQGGSLAWVS